MSKKVYVCHIDELPEVASKGIKTGETFYPSHLLVKKNQELFVYQNRCPHTGAPMEWKPDQFLDFDNDFIQCALHGALFRIETGECLRGPCLGKSLEKEQVMLEEGRIYFIKRDSDTDRPLRSVSSG
jgi:nitrite reductase/ring-hydroxylating ferredoxin subunit